MFSILCMCLCLCSWIEGLVEVLCSHVTHNTCTSPPGITCVCWFLTLALAGTREEPDACAAAGCLMLLQRSCLLCVFGLSSALGWVLYEQWLLMHWPAVLLGFLTVLSYLPSHPFISIWNSCELGPNQRSRGTLLPSTRFRICLLISLSHEPFTVGHLQASVWTLFFLTFFFHSCEFAKFNLCFLTGYLLFLIFYCHCIFHLVTILGR